MTTPVDVPRLPRMSIKPEAQMWAGFPGFGVELEYMIVDRDSGAVMPVADEVLRLQAGAITSDVEFPDVCWSNELVLHVIELKTNGPARTPVGLADAFTGHVRRINALLQPLGGRLMPTGMHPWMDPHRDTRLWPHDASPVYQAFDRIFGCSGHGWSNLQSVHLNLPFADDDEFGRLHAAIRLVLPILPALAASSPIMDGAPTGVLDTRLEVYRTNCARIPSLTGAVIPEPVFSVGGYHAEILERLYRDIAPHDPEGLLQDEFLNARGAIARFVRNTIEIRVIDAQECAPADVAVCALVMQVLRELMAERWLPYAGQQAWQVEPLQRILLATIRDGQEAVISEPSYLRMFGMHAARCSVGELWSHLATGVRDAFAATPELQGALRTILQQGSLARRILESLGQTPHLERIREVYAELSDCLQDGRMFQP